MSDDNKPLSLRAHLSLAKDAIVNVSTAVLQGSVSPLDLELSKQQVDVAIAASRTLLQLIREAEKNSSKAAVHKRALVESSSVTQVVSGFEQALSACKQIALKRICSQDSHVALVDRIKYAVSPLRLEWHEGTDQVHYLTRETFMFEMHFVGGLLQSVSCLRTMGDMGAPLGVFVDAEVYGALLAADPDDLARRLDFFIRVNNENVRYPSLQVIRELHNAEEELLVPLADESIWTAVRTCGGVRVRYSATPIAVAAESTTEQSVAAGLMEGCHDFLLGVEVGVSLDHQTNVVNLSATLEPPVAMTISAAQQFAAIASIQTLQSANSLAQLLTSSQTVLPELPFSDATVAEPSVLVSRFTTTSLKNLRVVMQVMRKWAIFTTLYQSCLVRGSHADAIVNSSAAPHLLTMQLASGQCYLEVAISEEGQVVAKDILWNSQHMQSDAVQSFLKQSWDASIVFQQTCSSGSVTS